MTDETSFFLYKLIGPRPTFGLDLTPEEAEVMGRHAAYWQDLMARGAAVVFGPVFEPAGTWGLCVVKADGEDAVRGYGEGDPAVTSGVATFEVHPMGPTISAV